MQIFICDDEPEILNFISAKIHSYFPEDAVRCFSSGKELVEAVRRGHCDFLLLDIDMPDVSGMMWRMRSAA